LSEGETVETVGTPFPGYFSMRLNMKKTLKKPFKLFHPPPNCFTPLAMRKGIADEVDLDGIQG